MVTDIVFPEFAEDGDERAKVISWLVEEGQPVEENDEVVELLTDKATFTVLSPAKGTLKILITPGTEISVNAVMGQVISD
jgi:pyruvate/2-oxoglutarate dehydrogenase complex dihydrolipoamide acyltransferase (E2) component